jgi:hypothetical protein
LERGERDEGVAGERLAIVGVQDEGGFKLESNRLERVGRR